MSIESAINGSAANSSSTQDKAPRTRLHGRIVDVHVDKDNPLKSYITVEADAKNNLGMFSGTYNVSLNQELTAPQRYQAATRAKERGSGVCGGLINEKMMRRKGKPVLLNNFRETGEHVGTCRWIDFSRKEVHRRAALVHTAEVKSRANQGEAAYPRITNITVMRHDAFDVDDQEAVERMKALADRHFSEATKPRDHTVPRDKSDPDGDQLQHLRSSMPRSAFAFVIIDDNSKEVMEYSDFLHRRQKFKDSDMPGHFTQEDIKEFNGKYPSLPYNGESIQNALNLVKGYAEKTYGGGEISPKVLCVEGVRYRTSKVAESTDIQSPRTVEETPSSINEMSPVEMIHLASKTQFATSISDNEKNPRRIRNCAYVNDITFNFADNKGDTYSRFIDCKSEYPSLDTPWISKITFQQEPLVIPEVMKEPVVNAVNGSKYAPHQEGNKQDRQSESPTKSPTDAEHVTPDPAADAPANTVAPEDEPQPQAEPPADQQEAPKPQVDDPSFAENERLDAPSQQDEVPAARSEAEAGNPDADIFHDPGSFTFGR